MKFKPCTGECTDEGSHCEGCGRSHEEIAEMKEQVAQLVAFAEKMNYENIEDFADAVAGTIRYQMGEGH
jgi:methionyl-tRNA synthetase